MKRIIGILFVAGMATAMMAVPAKRDGMVRTMEDGTQVTVFLHGNETFHYMTDAAGVWLNEETLKPMTEAEKNEKLRVFSSQPKRAPQAQNGAGVSRLLSPRGPIILVSYKDKEFENPKERLEEWAMGENYAYNNATGSIHQYFMDQSWGAYDLELDVYGPVTVSKNASYYGSNDASGNDKHPDELVQEACILAHDSCGADFSQYDSNGDGKVDWVVVMYAGKGEADGGGANTVWPHQYELRYTGMSFYLDGKKVDHYCCLNEIDASSNKLDGVGTFCHEFGHIMGLPDLYATNGATHHTLCEWDVMDYGAYNNNGNTPPAYSAYERWFMGWSTPRVLTDPEYVTLGKLNETQESLLMCEGDAHNLDGLNPSPITFYLIENRNKEGWDKYLPGRGMLLTKVKYNYNKWSDNTVNNTKTNMGVDLIEAKENTTSGYSAKGKSTDAFPAGASEYTAYEGHEITEIVLRDGVVAFSYRGAEPQAVESVPVSDKKVQKIIRNGQIIILREGKTYDILGNQL